MLQSSSSIASPFRLTPPPPPLPPPLASPPARTARHKSKPTRWRAAEPSEQLASTAPAVVVPRQLVAPPVVQPFQLPRGSADATLSLEATRASWLTWIRWRQWLRQRIDDVERAPSWLVSLVFHLCLILILALITAAARSAGPVLLMSFDRGDAGDAAELAVFDISQSEANEPELAGESFTEPEQLIVIEPVAIPEPTALLAFAPAATATTTSNSHTVESVPAISDVATGDMANGREGSDVTRMFSGRTGPMKAALLRKGGGDATTEQSVALGLAWLKRQQQPDGSWSMRGPYSDGSLSQNPVAATSMAMLAFMGAGNTHRTGDYKKELWDAVRWLAKQQDAKGFMAHDGGDHEKMYAQAQATIALCELYAMTGDSWLRPKAQLACDFAVAAQSPEGGWRYYPRLDSDTSVTGWFVMGLKSGQVGNLTIDPYVFTRVRRYLETVARYDGAAYAYQPQDIASPSMTAEGLLIQQYLGMSRDEPVMNQGLNALVTNHLIDADERDVYYWYYATQAIHHLGNELWDKWNGQMKRTIPTLQRQTGREAGSWDPGDDEWGSYAGRLYVTCLSIYCLEVYYRHLPLYETTNVIEQ